MVTKQACTCLALVGSSRSRRPGAESYSGPQEEDFQWIDPCEERPYYNREIDTGQHVPCLNNHAGLIYRLTHSQVVHHTEVHYNFLVEIVFTFSYNSARNK